MEFSFKTFQQLSGSEVYAILKLRSQIFVLEQNCLYLDIDGIDQTAYHLCAFNQNDLIAYCRILPPGLMYNNPAIGRVVVDQKFRKQNIGVKLMQTAIKKTNEVFKNQDIIISAQTYLLKFYNTLGFKAIGETYLEDGIPHIKMNYAAVQNE